MFSAIALTAVLCGVASLVVTGDAVKPLRTLAVGSVSLLVLSLLLGPMVIYLWIAFVSVTLAAQPVFPQERKTARRVWAAAHLSLSVILILIFTAEESEMFPLILMLFGPGAVVSAWRLAAGFRTPPKAGA